ncbi:AFI_G0017610.mRNA.1.CDS.1 [Saccharomyces cerevisiae]|nr:AFI_G0017610.mRNA.1.CDS.1 [Saccharomyces cerevisiae]CAI6498711.1 AIS_HP1_G0017560.mRNA.1.CDS.1 [Saccharomyces cerevisiae]CAI6651447.1 AFI_G0017610.mRNA.1.CDS.1 [Saccharomyces cerevisiae]
MPIIGVPGGAGGCLEKPFCASVKFPLSVKKNIRILDLDPRTEAYCLSPYSVCSKRLPWKKCFYLLKSVQDIRRVSGVVYCWGLQICELSAIILVQLRNCSR